MLSRLRPSTSQMRGGFSSLYSRAMNLNSVEFTRPPTTFAQANVPQPIISRIFATEATTTTTTSSAPSPPVTGGAIEPEKNSNNKSEGGDGQKGKRKSRKTAVLGALGVTFIGIYVADLLLNDDWDTFTDSFRSRLSEEERKKRPRLVILGGGWGALSMLRKLHTDQFNVTIISPRNYFLFTPLLPSTTTGELESRSIIEPIRNYCVRAGALEVDFIEAECINIDPATQKVRCVDDSPVKGKVFEFEMDYDYLVVAVGADNATFNIPGVKEHGCFMKEVGDSQKIRNKIMDCVETAMIPGQPLTEVQRLLHFVVVGGGPSGVEFTADLYDFVKQDLKRHFPKLGEHIKITLVEALPHILNMFDKQLISVVEKRFEDNPHITVANNSAVTQVKETSISIKKRDTNEVNDIPYGMLVWATGNAPRRVTTDLIKALPKELQPFERRGLAIDSHLRVKGTNNIWALGDCTATNVPATAQAAGQEGRYLGRLFNRVSENMFLDAKSTNKEKLDEQLKKEPEFVYKSLGMLAYIGDQRAIAEFSKEDKFTSSGFLTFFLWRSVYFSRLLSVRNRFNVALDWTKAAIFGRDISRC